MTDNLTHLRICVERPLPGEEHVMKRISEKSNSNHHFKKLSAAFVSQKMWPKDTTIKISFNASPNTLKNVDWTPMSVLEGMRNNDGSPVLLDPIEKEIRKLSPIEAVKKIVRERIQPLVGLKFVFVSQGGNVRVSFNPNGGAYSLVGTDCLKSEEQSTMNLGWLDAGTIIHEFGHVLGMIHEHQNPKGKPIPWDDSAVYQWAKQTQGWDHDTTYHNIIERYNVDQLNASEFDPQSVMLYFFPPQLTTNHKGTNNNHRISPEDAIYISKVYPGGQLSPEEFYEHVYGESLNQAEGEGKTTWKTILFVLAGLVALFMIYWIIRFFVKKRKSTKGGSYKNFSHWNKSRGGSQSPHSYRPLRFS